MWPIYSRFKDCIQEYKGTVPFLYSRKMSENERFSDVLQCNIALFTPLEKIIKLEVFYCFQGV